MAVSADHSFIKMFIFKALSLSVVQGDGLPSLEQLACEIVDGEFHLSEKPKKYLKRFFQQSIYRKLVEESILSYLNYNHYHLPMYAWPGIV